MNRKVEVKPISVEYIDHMGSDKRVVNAAKVSFSKWDGEDSFSDKDANLLAYLATGLPSAERGDWEKVAKAHTHWTPFAHCFLSVRVSVPIFLARQLHKHTVGLVINEESRRYIKEDVSLWLPDVVHKAPAHAKQGASDEAHDSLLWIDCDEDGDIHVDASEAIEVSSKASIEMYYRLLDAGVAPEEARIVLPLNAMTTWIWSGSLLAFNRVYQLRKDGHAQTCAREFAHKLGEILYEHFPESMKALNYGEQLT